MDSFMLFKKLSSGAKFDFKKFHADAEKLKLVKKHNLPELAESIDKSSGFYPRFIVKDKIDLANQNQKEFSYCYEARKRKLSGYINDTDGCITKRRSKSTDKSFGESEDNYNDEDLNKIREDNSLNSEQSDDDSNDIKIGGNIIATYSKTKKTRKKKKNKMPSSEKLIAQRREQISHFRKQHCINIWGSDIPDPISNFQQLLENYNISSCILENIKKLGYLTPTPIQMQTIPLMIDRREVLACAPTGSGKTAAFLVPLLHYLKKPSTCGFRIVIVSPTRELSNQIYRDCLRLAEGTGIKACIMSKNSKMVIQQTESDILITTPNRLVYMLQQEQPGISLQSVQWLIIDESDKLFETGTLGFRDQLAVIYKACDSPNIRRAMFSATFSFDVEEWCKLNLDNVVMISIGVRNSAADSVKQELLFVGDESGKLLELRNIIKKGITPPVLIFVETKDRARELFSELMYEGINVDAIHSERTREQRDNVVKSFRAGKIWVLICTELMGRGIDFKGVNLVINYDFPRSNISYIHRIGRTGRAGRPGRAITFFTESDRAILRSIAQVMKNSGCEVPDYMLKLKKPSKKIKRQLLKKAPKRDRISTVPLYDLEKQAKKEKLVLRSKLKKKLPRKKK